MFSFNHERQLEKQRDKKYKYRQKAMADNGISQDYIVTLVDRLDGNKHIRLFVTSSDHVSLVISKLYQIYPAIYYHIYLEHRS
jgi:hypothetical protein